MSTRPRNPAARSTAQSQTTASSAAADDSRRSPPRNNNAMLLLIVVGAWVLLSQPRVATMTMTKTKGEQAESNLGITQAREAAEREATKARAELGPAQGHTQTRGAKNKQHRKFPTEGQVNIMDWIPPPHAKQFDKDFWKDAQTKTYREVEAFQLGGPPLRKFISEKVARLKALRENLFGFLPVMPDEREF